MMEQCWVRMMVEGLKGRREQYSSEYKSDF